MNHKGRFIAAEPEERFAFVVEVDEELLVILVEKMDATSACDLIVSISFLPQSVWKSVLKQNAEDLESNKNSIGEV